MAAARSRTTALTLMLVAGLAGTACAKDAAGKAEPNTQVPAGSTHYAATGFPDRIVASPAQDASTNFAVAWRTDARSACCA